MSDPHPRYPKPTIVEATCEIAFVNDSNERLTSRSLYSLVGDEFPEMQPLPNLNVQYVVQPGVMFPALQPDVQQAPVGFRFATASNDRFVQFSANNFVYQIVNGPYEGWDEFKTKLMHLWSLATGVLKPKQIVKIGLRYVNRIALDAEHPHLIDWLQPSDDIPASILQSKGHFLARIESTPSLDNLKLITLANQVPDSSYPHGAVILDIDCVNVHVTEAANDVISKKLEVLHEDIWAVFSSSKTAVLEAKLNGG